MQKFQDSLYEIDHFPIVAAIMDTFAGESSDMQFNFIQLFCFFILYLSVYFAFYFTCVTKLVKIIFVSYNYTAMVDMDMEGGSPKYIFCVAIASLKITGVLWI